MHFHIITLFPEMFDSYLSESILARAIKSKKIKAKLIYKETAGGRLFFYSYLMFG